MRGVVVWLTPGTAVTRVENYLDWLDRVLDQGKKLIIMENIGVGDAFREDAAKMARLNRLYARLGFKDLNSWNATDLQYHIAGAEYADDGIRA